MEITLGIDAKTDVKDAPSLAEMTADGAEPLGELCDRWNVLIGRLFAARS